MPITKEVQAIGYLRAQYRTLSREQMIELLHSLIDIEDDEELADRVHRELEGWLWGAVYSWDHPDTLKGRQVLTDFIAKHMKNPVGKSSERKAP